MNDRLVEYAAGTLTPAERATVDAHLAGCATCRADLAAWRGIADAPVPSPPPASELIHRVLVRSAMSEVSRTTPRRAELIRAQLRLLRAGVLVASALVMALGVVLGPAGLVLVTPFVAAAGISGAYGPRRDPAFEVVAATPTSQRLILAIRVLLVLGYDLVLALAASALLVAAGAAGGVGTLVAGWLGPTAVLSALCLLLVVWLGPDVAIGAALALWSMRVLADNVLAPATGLVHVVRLVWTTGPATGLTAAVLAAAAMILVGRGEPVRHSRATHLM
ncbi:zf-HC2 domain-containing protein [Actinoplanes sp. NPDC049265]|uniref:zf-HC2 domain-containing protein n=1 Tax=Actinoplanes sp. NPDC049265 TaxID=3363902 RepID=UPI00371098AE